MTCLGILLLSAALLLFLYNVWDSRRAEQNVEVILQEYEKEEQKILEDGSAVDGDIPDYQLDPEKEMPEIALESANGAACIGTLEIPSLDLTLPVMSEWPLSLFTCTADGKNRVTVRCE